MSYFKEFFLNVLIYLSLGTASSVAKFLKHESFEDAASVTKCILAIADSDVYRRSTVILSNGEYIDDVVKIDDGYVQTFMQILARAYNPQIVINNWHYLSETVKNYEEPLLIVFFINGCNSLAHLNETVKGDYKYLIIVNDKLKRKCNLDLDKIGNTLQHHDATFIIKDTNNYKYNLLTTIPEIDSVTCQYDMKVPLTCVNTCTNGKLKDRVIFPDKNPKNFKKCDFKVGMATMYPYAMTNNRDSLKNLQSLNESQIQGLDVEIIKIISNYCNASLQLYYIYREEENPYLRQEFVSFVINGSLDACAGGLYRIYGDLVDYSGVYTRQTVTWVYSVERESKSWQIAVRKINGLLIFILFYIGYSIIWIFFCNFEDIPVSCKNIFLSSWGALVAASSLQKSITWKQKILSISYMLLCIHLSPYLSIQLYSFFTIQGPPQTLKTNDDVMESGRTPYLINDLKYVVEDAKYKAFANTSKNCADFQNCEQKVLLDKGLTVLLEAYFHRLQAYTAIDNEARVLRPQENIFIVYHEMIVRKGSPFARKFKLIVPRLFEAGISDWLYLKAIGLLIEGKAKNAKANIMANSYRCESGYSINISQIAGVIVIWVIGCFMSIIVFVIEIFMDKKSTLDFFRR